MHWMWWFVIGLGLFSAVIAVLCIFIERQDRRRTEAALRYPPVDLHGYRKTVGPGGAVAYTREGENPAPGEISQYEPVPPRVRMGFLRSSHGSPPMAEPTTAELIRKNILDRQRRKEEIARQRRLEADASSANAFMGTTIFSQHMAMQSSPAPRAVDPEPGSQVASNGSASASVDTSPSSPPSSGGGD